MHSYAPVNGEPIEASLFPSAGSLISPMFATFSCMVRLRLCVQPMQSVAMSVSPIARIVSVPLL